MTSSTVLPETICDHPDRVMEEQACDGCKVPIKKGVSCRYRCGGDQQHGGIKLLHACCAVKPDAVDDHQQFPGETFRFYREHPDAGSVRKCDVCSGDVLGFVYHCTDNGADLHPCCALRRVDGNCRCSSNANGAGRRVPAAKHRTGAW